MRQFFTTKDTKITKGLSAPNSVFPFVSFVHFVVNSYESRTFS